MSVLSLGGDPGLAFGVGLLLVIPVALARAATWSGLILGGAAAAWFTFAGGAPTLAAFGALVIGGTAASRAGRARKEALGVAESRGGRRSARNVLANAGPAAALLLIGVWRSGAGDGSFTFVVAACGALAASLADTVAGELGMLTDATPRRLLFGRVAKRGENGAMSIPGTAFAVVASLVTGGLVATLLPASAAFGAVLVAVLTGGVAGAVLDSVLGATIEGRGGCDNEVVNACASLGGGLCALGLYGGAS